MTASDNFKHTSGRVWTISNIITITRILLVPVFVAILLAPWPEWFDLDEIFTDSWKRIIATGVFILISCTDWLDGYLARSRNEITDFGKFMDPLADKILVAAALISLVELGSLPTWVVLVILAREFIVSGIRMMAASKGVVIAASMLGKFKTVFQMIAIVMFTIKDTHMIGDIGFAFSDMFWVVSWIVMLVALVLTVISLVDYLVKARELFGFRPAQNTSLIRQEDMEIEVDPLSDLAAGVVQMASDAGVSLATAESLTGGLIASAITDVPGASAIFKGGIISYTNEIKSKLLDVSHKTLDTQGAVSEDTVMQMAQGARVKLESDIAIAVSGIAGPGGAEPGKPVGTVWIGVSTSEGFTTELCVFDGDRQSVRNQTVIRALELFSASIERIR